MVNGRTQHLWSEHANARCVVPLGGFLIPDFILTHTVSSQRGETMAKAFLGGRVGTRAFPVLGVGQAECRDGLQLRGQEAWHRTAGFVSVAAPIP